MKAFFLIVMVFIPSIFATDLFHNDRINLRAPLPFKKRHPGTWLTGAPLAPQAPASGAAPLLEPPFDWLLPDPKDVKVIEGWETVVEFLKSPENANCLRYAVWDSCVLLKPDKQNKCKETLETGVETTQEKIRASEDIITIRTKYVPREEFKKFFDTHNRHCRR